MNDVEIEKQEKNEDKAIELPTKLNDTDLDPDEMERMRRAIKDACEQEQKEYQKKAEPRPGPGSSDIYKALYTKEDGDASLYRIIYKNRLCFDHAGNHWYRWTGHFWELDKVKQAVAAIDEVIDAYAKEADICASKALEATKAGDSDNRKKYEKIEKDLKDRIAQLQHWHRKGNVLNLSAVGEGSLGISGEEWDLNPWLLGCPNGTLDLQTGKFRDGRQEDFIKAICPTKWEGLDKDAPTWLNFLSQIFDGDMELIEYLQRLFGYSLTGLSQEHVLPILWGQGRNGKGTLLETLSYILGELAQPVQAEMLLDQGKSRSSAGPSADLMKLRGCRMVWASETDEGRKLNAGKVKWLTGGDSISARPPFGKREISFVPTHILLMITNHKPRIASDEYALWKRIHLIPFSLSFVPDPQLANERRADKSLPQKLKAEAPGILAWLVKGCLEWQRLGDLMAPATVKAATDEYQSEEDVLGLFLGSECECDPQASVQASSLHSAYQNWCKSAGFVSLNMKSFGTQMTKRFVKTKEGGLIIYKGLDLRKIIPFGDIQDEIPEIS